MMTKYNVELNNQVVYNKFNDLVNQFYKILPMRESGTPTLKAYIEGLLREMLGLQSLMIAVQNDGAYLSLLGTLQYLLDHDCEVATVRSDVFKSINLIKKMQKKYGIAGE